MKKLLLSAVCAAACVLGASAQDFVFYGSTDHGKTFFEVKNGDEITVKPVIEHIDYPSLGMSLDKIDADLIIKIQNNTSEEWTEANGLGVLSYKEVYNNNSVPSGVDTPQFSMCFGSCAPGTSWNVTVPAKDEKDGTPGVAGGTAGDHMGFSVQCFGEGLAEQVKFDSKYAINFKGGKDSIDFTIVYTSDDASVSGLEADSNAPKEYYTLQGVRVAEPVKGSICIVKQGSKVSKQVIR